LGVGRGLLTLFLKGNKFITTSLKGCQLKHSELTSAIIGICIEVHRELGPGLLESVYEKAVCYELGLAGYFYERQKGIRTFYKGYDLDVGFRADIIVDHTVLVELKSVSIVPAVDKKIVLTYLRLTQIEVGLIINFNVSKLTEGITRLILDRNYNPISPY
jgi:GxxExxY protein